MANKFLHHTNEIALSAQSHLMVRMNVVFDNMKQTIAILIVALACASCAHRGALLYRASPNKATQLLYLDRFVTLERTLFCDKVSFPSETNWVYSLYTSHWGGDPEYMEHTGDLHEEHLVSRVERLTYNPESRVIAGFGIRPFEEDTWEVFEPPPRPKYFTVEADRVSFHTHWKEIHARHPYLKQANLQPVERVFERLKTTTR